MAEPLTELQQVILDVDALGLTVRDSIRQVSARVGFFIGQARYQDELAKAREIVAQGETISLTPPWQRLPFFSALSRAVGMTVSPDTDARTLRTESSDTCAPAR